MGRLWLDGLAAAVTLASCSSTAPIVDLGCTFDPSPTFLVDTSAVPFGRVTSTGACSPLECADFDAGACSLYVGTLMASALQQTCTVSVLVPYGQLLKQTIRADERCEAPGDAPQTLTFQP